MNNQTRKKSRRLLLFLLLVPAALGGLFLLLDYYDVFKITAKISPALDLSLHVVEVIGVLFALVLTLSELIASKEISRATFIMELNQSFVENKKYMRIYDYLQELVEKEESKKNSDSAQPDYAVVPDPDGTAAAEVRDLSAGSKENGITVSSISNYLTFFETMYLLHKSGDLSFEIIDDLFAYRFFLAVHSELFQKKKLLYQPGNFKNIYKLEREWLDYRVDVGKMKKEDLKISTDKYLGDVYKTRQLEYMVTTIKDPRNQVDYQTLLD